ncbi:hypothetical protein [Aneurinibacillus migulanus]|uniref:Uncharacterized protein n=1 Tax=Aneurinibacillus migulanus TaxID=47500 RepID=A0A0D1VHQ8_ANEMI|nr:hypothetical protein [Aneurinibacillus migulanus]KIV58999.1 hypothetical protein TS65_03420 [Aneurinibacillus migulanus]KON99298.1 hypothetical protein AF333_00760 [Aneurinibacillus migulanus]MED0893262.1 hypothetical protein [Aneurinibacillus migulanus]MED1615433.1 hypothetical protein [Aneurinibacillus migulanus]
MFFLFMDKKVDVAVKKESNFYFLLIVSFEKLARCCQTLLAQQSCIRATKAVACAIAWHQPSFLYSLWSAWRGGQKRTSGNAREFFLSEGGSYHYVSTASYIAGRF